ncbi:MAG TPA: hypothetical protein VIU16_02970 [Gaiellaceae bacterium]
MDVRDNEQIVLGPWTGLDEVGRGPQSIVRCLNIDVDEKGRIRRRPGRALLATLNADVPVSGIFQHVGLDGSRVLLVGHTYADPAYGAPKIGTVNESTLAFSELAVASAALAAAPERGFGFVAFKGRTMIVDPFARTLDFDGDVVRVLPAAQGLDRVNGLVGARAYLSAPPKSRYPLVWRNRLVAMDGRTIGLSATSGDINVPATSLAGAAEVWPSRTNLDVLTRDGDEIVGGAVRDDELLVLTRRGLGVVTEDDVYPTLRLRKGSGCIAPGSIQEVSYQGASWVFYLSDGKVCSWNGAGVEDISRLPNANISSTLDTVNWQGASRAVSVHYAKRNEYRLWLPVHGGLANRVCLIFNYVRRTWRVYAGYYPWDTSARQAAAEPFDVTAAAVVLSPAGEEILLTGDSSGRLWREDVGEDDAGTIFPAFALFPAIGSGGREFTFRDWRVEAVHDGSYVEGMAIVNGVPLEHELDRIKNGDATSSERKLVRAIQSQQAAYEDAPAYPVDVHAERTDKLRLSFAARGYRMQPYLSLPGRGPAVEDPSPGGVRLIEIGDRKREGGR